VSRLFIFWRKYTFPFHAVVLKEILFGSVSRLVSTCVLRWNLKLSGGTCGVGLRADGSVRVWAKTTGSIHLGESVTINSRFNSNLVGLTNPTIFQCLEKGTIRIGNNSGLSSAILSARSSITLGEYVKLGGNVRIFDHDYHSLDWEDRREPSRDQAGCRSAPVSIGNDVFIGTNTLILKGVTIGDRAIIGAGSVLSKDVPADEIWAGNPARKVRGAKIEPLPEFGEET